MAKLHNGKRRDMTSVPGGSSRPVYNRSTEMGIAPQMKMTPAKPNGIRSVRRTKAAVRGLYVG
jgi:hypothetical protein